MRIRLPKIALLILLLAAAIISSSCQSATEPAKQSSQELPRERVAGTRGGSLVYRLTSPPKTFNYLMVSDEYSFTVAFYLMSGRLAEFDHDTQTYRPALAAEWKLGDDGRTLDVTLRDDIKFSDGHALTAEDVLFTFQALYDERTASPTFKDAMTIGGRPIEVSVIEARRLRLVFPEAVATPENYLSNLAVLPKHVLEGDLKRGTLRDRYSLSEEPNKIVTAGAFIVESSAPGERVTLKRNPFYWKKDSAGTELPYLDTLTLEVVGDQNAALTRLTQGALNIVDRIRPTDYSALRGGGGGGQVRAYDLGPGLTTDHLWFNLNEGEENGKPVVDPVKRAWFSDVRFRRAVAYAVDRESIATSVLQGLATPLYGFVSPGNKAWAATDVPRTEYNLDKARALLSEAGFQLRGSKDAPELLDSKGNRVEFTLIVPVENEARKGMGAIIQEDLSRLGIKVTVAPVEFQALTARWQQSKDYDAILLGTSVTEPDPSSYVNYLISSSPTRPWQPKKPAPTEAWEKQLDELLTTQAHERDAARRKALFRDAQIILAEQLPVIPIVARHIISAANSRVRNYRPSTIVPYSLWNAEELFVNK
ncbi:MAG: ABC transporter substrate-binding protein [Pyrinomonadaceae bacterium]|nr:ABC transporter substrate-binding protein [Pyrinomonadaceae bacterium]